MNTTEKRMLYGTAGLPRPKRTLSDTELSEMMTTLSPSNQQGIRAMVEKFVQAHFDVLKETLSCQGDCASVYNACPDAQAVACYLINKDSVDPS